MGFHDVLLSPEPESRDWTEEYDDQVEWEDKALRAATCNLFWVPRELEKMPAFTTNVEFGMWCSSGKVVLGYPSDAPKMKYLDWHARKHGVPVLHNLRELAATAVGRVYKSVSLGETDGEAGWVNFVRQGKDIGKRTMRIIRVFDSDTDQPMMKPWVLPTILTVLARRFVDDPQFVEELRRLGLRLESDG
jgi:hypothetical protein